VAIDKERAAVEAKEEKGKKEMEEGEKGVPS
jgi:hypothetical protein